MRSLLLPLALAFGAATAASAQSSGKLNVSVAGVRNDNGSVRCGNGVPAGKYAIAVFHAEHNETQMETGMFGKPKQGYGFSNNPSSTFGPPSFESAAFTYKGGALQVPVRLSY